MNRKALLLFALLLTGSFSAFAKHKKIEVIAYYTGDGETINNYPVDKLTHIIYSFLHLKGDTISFDNDKQPATLTALTALKQRYPKLKVMISLGGWSGCETCSPVFANAESRNHFAASVVSLLKTYHADGIDLDWEYPAIEGFPGHAYSDDDRKNFTELIKTLRKAMGKHYELSFAAGGFNSYLEKSVEWDVVMPLVTRVNLMTYDLINGYSKQTGHHTALYGRDEQMESTDNCVQYLLNKGMPAHKLVIGAAFYARIWENVPDTANGLYQAGSFKEGVDYKQFNERLAATDGWTFYWDSSSKAPYAYNASQKLFATFDDEHSLAEKVAYAKKYKLGGIMFWELMNDTYTNGRVDAIFNALK